MKFLANLKLHVKTQLIEGDGVDEDDNKVGIKVNLDMEDTYRWKMRIENDTGAEELKVPALTVDRTNNTLSAEWSNDDGNFSLSGTIDR